MTLSHFKFHASLAVVLPFLLGLASPIAASREPAFQVQTCTDHCPATAVTVQAPTNQCCVKITSSSGAPTDGTHTPETCTTCDPCTRDVGFDVDDTRCWGGITWKVTGPGRLSSQGSGSTSFSMTLSAACQQSSVPLTMTVYFPPCSDSASETVSCGCGI